MEGIYEKDNKCVNCLGEIVVESKGVIECINCFKGMVLNYE